MISSVEQLDRRFAELERLHQVQRPARGWVRAIREALGMTTAQLAARLGVKQPRVVELEHSEIHGNVTLQSLERAAEAMGCRMVYSFVPIEPLTVTMNRRAAQIAARQLGAVEHSMQLEAQGVTDHARHDEAQRQLAAALLRKPARLWDEP